MPTQEKETTEAILAFLRTAVKIHEDSPAVLAARLDVSEDELDRRLRDPSIEVAEACRIAFVVVPGLGRPTHGALSFQGGELDRRYETSVPPVDIADVTAPVSARQIDFFCDLVGRVIPSLLNLSEEALSRTLEGAVTPKEATAKWREAWREAIDSTEPED